VASLTQEHRHIALETPLGPDVLLLTNFYGHEQLSHLFQFQLKMVSEDPAIAAADIVGKNVTISVKRGEGDPRYFNGFINRFVVSGKTDDLTIYRAEMVPWLWFLTQTSDCRIFQQKKLPDIIQQIFDEYGFSDYDMTQVKGKDDLHPTWDYCVQFRETDFNFVSRRMEHEGMFYYFKHEEGKHTLHIADQKGGYYDAPEKEVECVTLSAGRAYTDHISTWEHQYEFRPGKVSQTDYNYITPSTSLMTSEASVVKLPGIDKYEKYDYPGAYLDKSVGEAYTKILMEAEEVPHNTVTATSTCKTFSPGGSFAISRHDDHPDEEGKKYVVTSVEHRIEQTAGFRTDAQGAGVDYANSFTCIPSATTYRPERTTPKPVIPGPQTATVTTASGEEIWPNEYGCVKVQFHWDREGKRDEKSSCWIRVSQVHASKGFGGIDIPRVGDEVIVAFLDGNPDLPIVVGRVYHAENMPPFGLPGAKNISGLKSNSSKGGGGYNEYVLDDTKGNELIREHGQFDKDSTIEHDLREHVLNDRSRDVTNNETISVGVDRAETVGNNETYAIGNDYTHDVGNNETRAVGSDRTRTVGGSETVTVTMMRTHTVGINEAITVGAAQEVTVGGIRAVTVGISQATTIGTSQTTTIGTSLTESVGTKQSTTVGSDMTESIGGNRSESVAKDKSVSVTGNETTSVGKKYALTANDEISLVTGDASIIMKKDGTIQIKGKDISIIGSGQITGKATKDMVLKGKNILQN
jgi:type VI secretion system secreted protein VgrG